MLIVKRILGLLCICLMLGTATSMAQDSSSKELLSLISEIEDQTGYRFLYKESLVIELKVELKSTASTYELFKELESELDDFGIGLRVDDNRKQVLLYKSGSRKKAKNITVNGYVLDASSGERLPYATVAWKEDGNLKGVAANNSGRFIINIETMQEKLTFLFSFLGYEAESVELDLSEQNEWSDLAIRLQPEELFSREIIINAVGFYSARDTVYNGLVETGKFSPLGEGNSIRALQLLPSVQTNTAINEGLNIRGSSSDGFQVLLDGVTIYNQSHLFGLLDSFNSDVLQSSGFYYDISPAQIEAPLGGTLSLITKSGNLREYEGNIGLSNTSFRGTLEGPIAKGKSSFLLSGRHSYMNSVNWFNNSDLIEWGLDINRPQSIEDTGVDLEEIGLTLGDYNAEFYDVHTKLYFDNANGSRLQISGYVGADNTQQNYTRCLNTDSGRPCFTPNSRFNNNIVNLDTQNKWGAGSVSVQYQKPISNYAYSQSTFGFSTYDMDYLKDDFLFRDDQIAANDFRYFPLIIENALNEFQLTQSIDAVANGVNMSLGINYHWYEIEYREDSFERFNLFQRSISNLVDLYGQFDFTGDPYVNLFLGSRVHYFSNGNYLKWSPRAKIQLFPENDVSFGFGFSRNYQFLNRIQFDNANSADVWIMADENEAPSSVNHLSSGIYMKLSRFSFFQVEGYIKSYEDLRLHELSTVFLNFNLQSETPFFSQTKGIGQGLEFLLRNNFGNVDLTTNYTLSSMELESPFLNDGDEFYAEWDRRHQFVTSMAIHLNSAFTVNTSWTLASGVPNTTFAFERQLAIDNSTTLPEERLGSYSRFDISLNFSSRATNGRKVMEGNLFLFNVFDNQNVWYRDFDVVFDRSTSATPQFVTTPVDVFDLGFQPSFNLTLFF